MKEGQAKWFISHSALKRRTDLLIVGFVQATMRENEDAI